MTNTDIMKMELNNDLSLITLWRKQLHESKTESERDRYLRAILRNINKVDAKAELIQSLGYTILFTDDRTECISIYPIELDD